MQGRLDVQFTEPPVKSYIIPQNKSAVKEKEQRRKEKKKLAQSQLKSQLKVNEHKTKKQIPGQFQIEKKVDPEMRLLRLIMNEVDPKDYTNKEEIKIADKKDELSFTEVPEIIKKTEFLNTAEYQEIKDQYSDFNIGELVLKFPNPDREFSFKDAWKDRPVEIFEAEKVFNDCMTVITDGGIPQSLLKQQYKAFLCAFLQLDDYVEKDPNKIKAQKRAEEEEQLRQEEEKTKGKGYRTILELARQKKKIENEEPNNDIIAYQAYMEQYRRPERIPTEERAKQQKSKSVITVPLDGVYGSKVGKDDQVDDLPVVDIPPPEPDMPHGPFQTIPVSLLPPKTQPIQVISELPVDAKEVSIMQYATNYEQGVLDQQPIYKLEQTQPTQPDLDLSDPVEEQLGKLLNLIKINKLKTSNFKGIYKKFCGGQFLYKRYTADKTDYDWIQIGKQPADFLTLIRQMIVTKLARDGHFHIRQFISTDDKNIYVVLKSKLNAIRRVAEQMRFYKQYEIGYADLLSLEPCDQRLRPLRLKQYLRDPEFELKMDDYLDEEPPENQLTRVENVAQKLFQNAQKWGDKELRAQLMRKQKKLDVFINKICKELHISLNHEKVSIVDDPPLDRSEWESYYVYQEYLLDYLNRVQRSESHAEIKKNKGFLYKLIFRKAIGDSNEIYEEYSDLWMKSMRDTQILKNMWDRQGIPSISPYGQFFNTSGEESLWRQFEVNEKGLRSEFMNVEKLKIANAILLQHINIKKLIEKQFVESYFALHDPYQLLGMPKAIMIKPLMDLQLVTDVEKSVGHLRLNDLFISLKDEAEGADFDGDAVSEEAAFRWYPPWSMPIDVIRDYYGEKIALYFKFVQFFTRKLWYVVIVCIICEGVIDSNNGDEQKAFIVIFATIIMLWASFFIADWKREQVMFQIEFGQQEQTEAGQIERPGFDGNFIRSIVTDKLNEEIFPSWKKQLRLFLSLSITLLLILLVIASVVGIFIFKAYLVDQDQGSFVTSFVPSMLNAIIIQIFNVIYFSISNVLNDYENHKYESEYENSLIMKTFFFIFINTFNCLAIIAFLNTNFPSLGLCKVPSGENCYKALQNQMVTIFMVNFAKLLPQLIMPCLKNIIRSSTKKVDEDVVIHEFNQIDQFIESQGDMEAYQSNAEVDGLMNDYMELIVQFSFLQLFGLAFPLSYLIAFITNVAQLQVDKLKLIYFMQRPIPASAADIGNWLLILELITFLSVFSNAGLVVFTSGTVTKNNSASFAIFVLVFLGVRYFSSIIISPTPQKAKLILARHRFAIERVHRGMKATKKGYFVLYSYIRLATRTIILTQWITLPISRFSITSTYSHHFRLNLIKCDFIFQMSKKDQKKKKYFKKQGQQCDLSEIMSGFLITCDKNREREAVKEAYQLIESYIERSLPAVSQRLEELIEQNTSTQKVKILYNFDTKINCVIFIKVNKKQFPEVDVDLLARAMLQDANEKSISRYCYKCIPIQYVFASNLEELKKYTKLLIEQYFTLDKPISWFLVFKARYSDKFNKLQILNVIRSQMEPLHPEEWKDPELVFFVELNGAVMYLNILTNYQEYHEYSIFRKHLNEDEIKESQGGNLRDKFEKQVRQREPLVKPKIADVQDFQKEDFLEEKEFDLL